MHAGPVPPVLVVLGSVGRGHDVCAVGEGGRGVPAVVAGGAGVGYAGPPGVGGSAALGSRGGRGRVVVIERVLVAGVVHARVPLGGGQGEQGQGEEEEDGLWERISLQDDI